MIATKKSGMCKKCTNHKKGNIMKESYNFVFIVKYGTSSYTHTKRINVYDCVNEQEARCRLPHLVKRQSYSANIITAECIGKYSREH